MYDRTFRSRYYRLFYKKIGISLEDEEDIKKELVDELLDAITGTDFTLFFRYLAKVPIKDQVCKFTCLLDLTCRFYH